MYLFAVKSYSLGGTWCHSKARWHLRADPGSSLSECSPRRPAPRSPSPVLSCPSVPAALRVCTVITKRLCTADVCTEVHIVFITLRLLLLLLLLIIVNIIVLITIILVLLCCPQGLHPRPPLQVLQCKMYDLEIQKPPQKQSAA